MTSTSRWGRRALLAAVGGVVVVVLVAAAGGYVYFFSGARSTPRPLSLGATSPASQTPAASGSLDGTWSAASGSTAGYRATEQFVGQSSSHQAVARTSQVSGTLTLTGSSTALEATSVKVTVRLGALQSQDTVAGRDVAQRDRTVQRVLETSSYPAATFSAQSIPVPAGAASGSPVTIPVHGDLTVHGVTKPVTVDLRAQFTGGRIETAGSIPLTLSDYGLQPPSLPFVTVQPAMQLEFKVYFAHQA